MNQTSDDSPDHSKCFEDKSINEEDKITLMKEDIANNKVFELPTSDITNYNSNGFPSVEENKLGQESNLNGSTFEIPGLKETTKEATVTGDGSVFQYEENTDKIVEDVKNLNLDSSCANSSNKIENCSENKNSSSFFNEVIVSADDSFPSTDAVNVSSLESPISKELRTSASVTEVHDVSSKLENKSEVFSDDFSDFTDFTDGCSFVNSQSTVKLPEDSQVLNSQSVDKPSEDFDDFDDFESAEFTPAPTATKEVYLHF